MSLIKGMRDPGIEPGSHRWQRYILPLDQSRLLTRGMGDAPKLHTQKSHNPVTIGSSNRD
jgi:hypothetical protein